MSGWSFNQSQIEEIIALYDTCNRNAAEAARRASFEVSRVTVRNYWRRNGLEIAPQGGVRQNYNSVTQEDMLRMREEYERCRDFFRVARVTGRSISSVKHYLRKQGVDTTKKRR